MYSEYHRDPTVFAENKMMNFTIPKVYLETFAKGLLKEYGCHVYLPVNKI